jgi:lipoic acid synthetase
MEERLPDWLKKHKHLAHLRPIKKGLRNASLSTVCEEARCPNITECFCKPTATFLIMGDICTRSCRFCSVKKGLPETIDTEEPANVAQAAAQLKLSHVVVTSVTRDDLPDKGASHFAQTIKEIRKKLPGATIEVLTPDFSGKEKFLQLVLDAKPDVFNHNVETVPRLYPKIRPEANFTTSINLLEKAKKLSPQTVTKSGFMVGLGEEEDEIVDLLKSLNDANVDVVTIGQYMRPSKTAIPVAHYWQPSCFEHWLDVAKTIGIRYVVSGPLVRSSYYAKEALEGVRIKR